ncbi:metallo beta-lactamase superfamily lipoprotein [Kurthia zopfii]|uniref:Beta-lactamase superfamily II metal-dependent hydrolase n=1 Tax=Kurthia zopfii TaxID=1650 RepID=A0A2U3ADC6_9BACL|nr:ComEC/Rec2 family competence protein [Kurthia zopfii]PWI22558.1 MBL fold metallo-hydrolase [Kurthia zopfii]TDR39014.1 beta-lactamase superfamily II metal-dependent hydrolase [Kurthia zopfii]STX09550.1 ComEC family competence protein [Kurthia zopfii]VEI06722.1 ComEC family competence protein [Kurthia zopfii]GEK31938.1 metallo beta-lactamase superfamily lipoprotein [Kurthia zopfii]
MKQKFIYAIAILFLAVVAIVFLQDEEPTSQQEAKQDTSVNSQSLKKSEEVKIHIIDIGQGDAILVQSKEDAYLIDGGNKGKGDDVLDYLHEQNVDHLTAVISTHPDADHIGGLAEVIRGIEVQSVYAPKVSHTTEAFKQFLLAVKEKSLKIKSVTSGGSISTNTSNLTLDFLGPTKDYSKSDLNDWSAVLQVTHGDKKFLLTGDAETPAERDMLTAGLLGPVDVLKVSHHGAAEATNKAFLDVVKPHLAAISVGEGNRYKHPTKDTLNRLKDANAKIYRTDQHGSIIFVSNGKNIIVKVER